MSFLYKVSAFAIFTILITTAALAEPQANYRVNCAQCHANDGSGKTSFAVRSRVPDLRSKEVQDMTDDEMYVTIARGTRHKIYPHAFELRGMSKPDIKMLVAYIRGMKK